MLSPDTAFDLLTLKEVCGILHISKAHACNLVAGRVRNCSRLPAIHMGRRMLIRREALAAWIAQNEAANDNLESSSERGSRTA
jgi:excisionase family DNA binding protein